MSVPVKTTPIRIASGPLARQLATGEGRQAVHQLVSLRSLSKTTRVFEQALSAHRETTKRGNRKEVNKDARSHYVPLKGKHLTLRCLMFSRFEKLWRGPDGIRCFVIQCFCRRCLRNIGALGYRSLYSSLDLLYFARPPLAG